MNSVLAIGGGQKAVSVPGPHFKWPLITQDTEKAVLKQLHASISIYDNSGIIDRLESSFRTYFGINHCLLTNSGTSALYSMYIGLGLEDGDEVICPSYTFLATVTPILFTGAIPIFVDCDSNGNIEPEDIKKRITDKTKAIVVTHMWGAPCRMDEIVKIAEDNNLFLLEDISHAFGAKYKGKLVGTFGDVAACSLQAQKTITGGEGGFLITNNSNVFYRSLLLGHYNKRCKKEIPLYHPLHKYYLTGMGLKLRIHPLAIAIAEEQFSKIDKILCGRSAVAKKIIEGLRDLKGLEVVKPSYDIQHGWYALIIKYKPEELGNLTIEKFYAALKSEGCDDLDLPVSTMPLNLVPLFQNPHELFPNYKNKFSYKKGDFPRAEQFYSEILKLPVWHTDEKVINQYIDAFKKVVINYKDLL